MLRNVLVFNAVSTSAHISISYINNRSQTLGGESLMKNAVRLSCIYYGKRYRILIFGPLLETKGLGLRPQHLVK